MNHKLMREAVVAHQAGRHEEAARLYKRLAVQFPRDPDLLHFRGLLASHMGDQAESIRLIEQAIAAKPGMPEFHQNLAISHQRAGDDKAASGALNEQGNALQKLHRINDAREAFEKSLALDPTNHRAACNYGAILNEAGEAKRALDVLHKLDRKLSDPQDRAYVFNNVATSHYLLGDYRRAKQFYHEALALHPDYVEAHRNLAAALLAEGNLHDGFREYEWRLTAGVHHMETRPALAGRVWRGEAHEEVAGPILVLAEQGFGDTIHFSRYVPMLAARGHDVIFEVQAELYNLFAEGWAGNDRIRVISRQSSGKLSGNPAFAALVSVMSLPHHFGTTLATVPADIPYIGVSAKRLAQWDSLIPRDALPNVGLIWQGSAKTLHDNVRSMPPRFLEPLLAHKSARFYSLQKGEAGKYEFATPGLIDLDARLRDFADTAAAIRHLDLVISIDSAVAHLAGAAGCPVWLAMPAFLDWRWMKERADSPWYPKHRLFRQKKPGDWSGVIADIGRALDKLPVTRKAA